MYGEGSKVDCKCVELWIRLASVVNNRSMVKRLCPTIHGSIKIMRNFVTGTLECFVLGKMKKRAESYTRSSTFVNNSQRDVKGSKEKLK